MLLDFHLKMFNFRIFFVENNFFFVGLRFFYLNPRQACCSVLTKDDTVELMNMLQKLWIMAVKQLWNNALVQYMVYVHFEFVRNQQEHGECFLIPLCFNVIFSIFKIFLERWISWLCHKIGCQNSRKVGFKNVITQQLLGGLTTPP